MLTEVREKLTGKNTLASFLETGVITPLRTNISDMQIVFDKSETPMREVRKSFYGFFSSYMNGIRWLHQVCGDRALDSPPLEPFQKWRPLHNKFRNEVIRASKFKDLRDMDAMFITVGWAESWPNDDFGFYPEGGTTPSETHT